MAMAKIDGTVTDIEGKSGGVVFRHDVCGQHIQAAPRIIKKTYTVEQIKVLDCFQSVNNYFGYYYDDPSWPWPPVPYPIEEVIERWNLYSSHYPKKSKKGRTYYLSWYQMYMSYNMKHCLEGLPLNIVPLPED